MKSLQRRAVDLFAGAGGLSLGLANAGWRIEAVVEFDEDAIATHKANIPDARYICEDIRNISFADYRGIDLIAGGPPCQPFSVSGHQRGSADERDVVPEFVRAVKEARPLCFLMENVPGLTTSRFHAYLKSKTSQLAKLGYDVHAKVLDAADFGVPQHRRRLFLVGVPRGVKFEFPPPTHGPHGGIPYKTVRQALDGVKSDMPNRAKVVYCKNPILRPSPHAGMLLNGKGRPLNMDAPSLTIPATAGGNRTHILDPTDVLIEYHKHLRTGGQARSGEVPNCRRLTIRESATIQTFPPDFTFLGKPSRQYCQIGNAVPVLLAEAVGKALLNALEKHFGDHKQSLWGCPS